MLSSESLLSCSSSSSIDKNPILDHTSACNVHKVKYSPHADWDFTLEKPYDLIDVSLALPHYRAHNQPVYYRMGMHVAAQSKPVKVKVCRQASQRSRFFLHIQAHTSDVTVWLPSDFKGRINHSSRASFSAGFVNRIMRNTYLNEGRSEEDCLDEDEVVISTHGRITLRMWDVNACMPEKPQKETLRRIFGCKHRAPETTIDWDFLLED